MCGRDNLRCTQPPTAGRLHRSHRVLSSQCRRRRRARTWRIEPLHRRSHFQRTPPVSRASRSIRSLLELLSYLVLARPTRSRRNAVARPCAGRATFGTCFPQGAHPFSTVAFPLGWQTCSRTSLLMVLMARIISYCGFDCQWGLRKIFLRHILSPRCIAIVVGQKPFGTLNVAVEDNRPP